MMQDPEGVKQSSEDFAVSNMKGERLASLSMVVEIYVGRVVVMNVRVADWAPVSQTVIDSIGYSTAACARVVRIAG